jgi:hypothetical protein
MADILVVDTCSLLNFNMFYIFDKNGRNDVYPKLNKFLLDEIKSKEIIVLDKVYDEIKDNRHTIELKKDIKPHVVKTLFLFDKVQELIKDNTRSDIIEKFGFNKDEVESKLREYEEKTADLYLIAYCTYLKEKCHNPILITEETLREDSKIIEKIPTICKKEGIRFERIPQILFEHYQDRLEFKLTVKSK